MIRPYGSGRSSYRGKQSQVRLLQLVPVQKAANGAGPEQRRIAVEDEQVSIEIRKLARRLQRGMAGAQLAFLNHIMIIGAQVSTDVVAAVAHHDGDIFGRHHFQRVLEHAFQNAVVPQAAQHDGAALRIEGVLARGENHRLAVRRFVVHTSKVGYSEKNVYSARSAINGSTLAARRAGK